MLGAPLESVLLPPKALIQRIFPSPGPGHPPRVIEADLLHTLVFCGLGGDTFVDSDAFVDSARRHPLSPPGSQMFS